MSNLDEMIKGKIPCAETGIEVKKSICSICNPDSHCALDVYVKDGKIIKVEGTLENPHNEGTICAKGAATRQFVYSNDRLLSPMRRVGEKGSGEFVPISWEEAYKEIAYKLNQYKKDNGPESAVFFSGYSKWLRPFLLRLSQQFGSPNFATESSTCFQATSMAWKLNFGRGGAPDFENSNCMMVWSRNPLHSQFYQARRILDALDRGMKLIVIDPRVTPMTQRADIHLRLKPGTDGALALAFGNVIINEKLYDKDFVEDYVLGFDEYEKYIKDYTPQYAEKITGVPAEQIIEAARMYAGIKPASVMVSASPVVHNINGVQNYRAVMALIGLTGNYDIKGGNIPIPFGYCHASSWVKTNEHEYCGNIIKDIPGIGKAKFPVWNELVDEVQSMVIPNQIYTEKPYPIKAILGFGLNHRMWPDSKYMADSLKKLDFFVNVDLFMTDTCKYADILLPACSSLERRELLVYNENYVIYTQPSIEPLGESKPDVDIIFELAKELGIDDEFFNNGHEAYVEEVIKPSGLTLEDLNNHPEGMYAKILQPYSERKYIKEGFKTPSGKMELTSTILEKYSQSHGYDPLPTFRMPYHDKAPFILNTGVRLPQYVHTRTFRIPWIKKLRVFPSVDIHPEDAKELGIQQNDIVKISTQVSSIEVKANVTLVGQKGVVFLYHGHPDADANSLVPHDHLDPISGFPGFKCIPCSVEKVK